jgi:hypothetical protein
LDMKSVIFSHYIRPDVSVTMRLLSYAWK